MCDPNGIYCIDYAYDAGGNRISKEDTANNTRVAYHYDLEDPAAYGSKNNRLMYYETFDTTTTPETLVSTTWYYYSAAGNPTRIVTGLVNPPVGGPEFTAVRFDCKRSVVYTWTIFQVAMVLPVLCAVAGC